MSYMASLAIDGNHFCGASLISWYHLLTAGFCINHIILYGGNDYKHASATLGSSDLYNGGKIYYIKDLMHHKYYYPVEPVITSDYDFGVILVCLLISYYLFIQLLSNL